MAKWIIIAIISCIAGSLNAQTTVWRAPYYHQILKIGPERAYIYETSGDNCVEVGSAKRRSKPKNGETLFSSEGSSADLQLKLDAEGHLSLSMFGRHEPNLRLERLASLPASCGTTPNTPLSNYDVFWRTFSELYPFFAQRNVDWASVDKQFRPQVTNATSPSELFDIFQKMIEPLHDRSTALAAENLERRFEVPEQQNPSGGAQQSEELIRKQYIQGQLRGYCHWIELGPKKASASPLHSGALIHAGMLDNSIGYLRIDDIAACPQELDHAFMAVAEIRGLIVDERFAVGGPWGLEEAIRLASRFAGKDYVGLSKVQGAQSEGQAVARGTRPGFTGPVAVLTGPDTAPVMELFALALIGREPPVIRVGGLTQGAFAFAEARWRTLPNGWSFRLPIGKYLAQDGRDYNFVGLPPDIAVPEASAADVSAAPPSRDLALEKAIETLKQSREKR